MYYTNIAALKCYELNECHLLLANTHMHTSPLLCSLALIVTQVWKKPPLEAHPWPPFWSSPRGGHTLVPPPLLHSSTVCHGCFKTIWPGCANGGLFWERDGKTVCYSRRPLEKKKRDCEEGVLSGWVGEKGVGGPPVYVCVQICLCVCSQPTTPVTQCSVGVVCRCRS